MKYLFIDTCSSRLIVSIVKDNDIIYCYNEINNNDTSSKVMPIIETAFKATNLTINEIDKLFVVNGPGSFTGIRVGVTIAKTIGFTLNIPVIPINELELMATTATNTNNVVMIDARRGFVYGAVYDKDLNIIFEPKYLLKDDIVYPDNYSIIDENNMNIDLLKVINKHANDEAINPHLLNPNYLKLTEAEEKLNDKGN